MAVDPKWLAEVRKKNRAAHGMGGLGSADHIAETLYATRDQRASVGLSQRVIEAEIRAKELVASDIRTAPILALPKIEIPESRPIPQNLKIAGVVAAAALVGLIIWRSS